MYTIDTACLDKSMGRNERVREITRRPANLHSRTLRHRVTDRGGGGGTPARAGRKGFFCTCYLPIYTYTYILRLHASSN